MVVEVPTTWTGRVKAQAVRTGQRMAPMADLAREAAAERLEGARHWAAPRLETAAHRFEDQVAPAVSSMLTAAAERISPKPRSRRWPALMLVTGIAVGAMGYLFYRRNAQQWTEHMKDSASDASRWVGEKAEQASNAAQEASQKLS
ncbi:YtxH domain-containing protein [Nonomuraea pusilla]|uniref:YtxH domain-containing protein n=1 Tax=Nonomuraea pusilla TaxID=46177 RepID=UPI001160D1A4|nr:YtxH domain-containing protein [Nonomuraea pusilla]